MPARTRRWCPTDRATNICERTIFIATGELLEMDLEDNEDTE